MIKFLFLFLSGLNAFDGIVTYYGLNYGLIAEANPLMKAIYEVSPTWFLMSKLGLSLMLLLLSCLFKLPNTAILRGLTAVSIVFYSYICMLHGVWIAQIG